MIIKDTNGYLLVFSPTNSRPITTAINRIDSHRQSAIQITQWGTSDAALHFSPSASSPTANLEKYKSRIQRIYCILGDFSLDTAFCKYL